MIAERLQCVAAQATFDDGKNWRRNLAWLRYAGAHWSYAEPDMIRVEIDEWSILIQGHRLESLFRAIEDATLARVRAYPEWEHDRDHEPETVATAIRLVPIVG